MPPLPAWKTTLCVAGAAACFHAAYLLPHAGALIFGYVACLTQLVRVATPRFAFYAALLTGLLCVAPQSAFFYGIFGPLGVVLWTVLAFWTALYVVLAHGIATEPITTRRSSSGRTAGSFSSKARACRSSFSRMACPRRSSGYGIRRGASSASASATT